MGWGFLIFTGGFFSGIACVACLARPAFWRGTAPASGKKAVRKSGEWSRFSRAAIQFRCALSTLFPNYGGRRLSDFQDKMGGTPSLQFDGKDVILVACDDVYFDRFAVPLLQSMNQLPETFVTHIHLTRPSSATIDAVTRLGDSLNNIQVSYTTDACNAAFPGNLDYIYYAAGRFLVAPYLLERGARRILAIDVDSTMIKSPWPIIDGLPPEMTVGFVFREDKKNAWQKILANAVLLKNDLSAKTFSNRFARALLVNLGRRQRFCVDQIVPYYLVRLSSSAIRSRIRGLPANIMAVGKTDDAAFWTVKGRAKWQASSPDQALITA